MKLLLQKILVNDISWKLFSPFIHWAERLKASRLNYLHKPGADLLFQEIIHLFPEKKVVTGPFKGMILGDVQPGGSSYFAKLLGSYESEIHHFIEQSFEKQYDKIINIGCDEGFYAVGYALQFKNTTVVAHDISTAAINKCRQLALLNGVGDRVIMKGKFTSSDISAKDKNSNSFFLVDCEGDERHIFTTDKIQFLTNADLLIELHLHTDPLIATYLIHLFSRTHDYELVNSIPDYVKATTYQYPQLENLPLEKKLFITEEREVFMQWIFFKAKQQQ